MPTTADDEKAIREALAALIHATSNCTKDELHYLWRREVLPTQVFEWLRVLRKSHFKALDGE